MGSTMLAEAEVIKVTTEVLQTFSFLQHKRFYLRISSSKIASAIFDYCDIPASSRVQAGLILTQLNKVIFLRASCLSTV